MKNNIKTFVDYINESRNRKTEAKVYLNTGMGEGFATIVFKGKQEDADELNNSRETWQNILDIAISMGAESIYSVEDEAVISQDEIDAMWSGETDYLYG